MHSSTHLFPLGSRSVSQFPLLFESFVEQQRKRKAFQSIGKHVYKLTILTEDSKAKLPRQKLQLCRSHTLGMCLVQGRGSGGICSDLYLPITGTMHGLTHFGEMNPRPLLVNKTGGILDDFKK